jgi:dihydroorotate dehydrogenase (NAD+) catalytic subunit
MNLDITTKVGGLILRNPTMLSAGVLGMTGKSLRAAWEAGAGAVVTKSLGIKSRKGYMNPTIVDVGCGFINAMGLPNSGANEFLNELSDASIGKEIVIIGSIYGANSHEFAETAQILAKGNISAIELNVSCPHAEGLGAELGQDPILVQEVVHAVKASTKLPVFVKLTPNVTSIVDLALVAEKAGADAIVAINTLRAMVIDIDTGHPVLANKVGGLSGPAIKPVAVRNVYDISQAVKIPVIGCGGITDWRDAVEFLLAGASAIQIGTAVAYRELNIFEEITSGISKYLAEKDFKKVEEIVGLSYKARP